MFIEADQRAMHQFASLIFLNQEVALIRGIGHGDRVIDHGECGFRAQGCIRDNLASFKNLIGGGESFIGTGGNGEVLGGDVELAEEKSPFLVSDFHRDRIARPDALDELLHFRAEVEVGLLILCHGGALGPGGARAGFGFRGLCPLVGGLAHGLRGVGIHGGTGEHP